MRYGGKMPRGVKHRIGDIWHDSRRKTWRAKIAGGTINCESMEECISVLKNDKNIQIKRLEPLEGNRTDNSQQSF